MISRIYRFSGELIRRLIPVEFRTWIHDDFIPAFVFLLLVLFFAHQSLLMIYMCCKWKGWILFYLGYYLWIRYDSKTLRTVGRKYSTSNQTEDSLINLYKQFCEANNGVSHKVNDYFVLGVENESGVCPFDPLYHHPPRQKSLFFCTERINWISSSSLLKCLCRYFPLRLIKLADLPPNKNYILACYPHSLVPLGGYFNLCTNANNVKDLFPNIDFRPVSATALFYIPGFREYLMSMGHCTFDMENLLYLMNSAPSKALLIWPGSFNDSAYSCSGGVYTIAMRQKGFVILALQSGASLVPVFSFGEQNTLDRVGLTGPFFVSLNERLYKYTKGSLCFWKGRGGYGSLLPYRRPLTTVVGKPIDVPKCTNPSVELINTYHKKFSKALHDLFEEYKGKFDEAGDAAKLIMK